MTVPIHTICVCGCGTMGGGIAQVTSTTGYKTIVFDANENALKSARQKLDEDLQKQIEKGKLTIERKDEILKHIHFTSSIDECKADLIIEAIVENFDVKVALFKELAALNPHSILASNTSSLSITKIAEQLSNTERVLGLHFFNPAPIMKLLEIVRTQYTSTTIVDALVLFTKSLNKVPVVCKDAPGFIVNRVARPFYIESLRLLEDEYASIETIDVLLEAQGFKMGPFKLMDLIGNDINYAVSSSVYEQLGKPDRLKPSDIQKEKVDEGNLGKKTGKGYYDYS